MTKPSCKYFGTCNGCSSQHLDHDLQVENKKKAVINAVGIEEVSVFSGKPYNYRNRMEFLFLENGVGLRRKNSDSSVTNIDRCEICDDRINEILNEINRSFKWVDNFNLKRKKGTFYSVTIRTSSSGECALVFYLNEDSAKISEAIEIIKKYATKSCAENVIVSYVDKDLGETYEYFVLKGKDMLLDEYLGKRFSYSALGFFQNNHEMAEKMQEYCNQLLKRYNTKESTLLDLYCGVGTFGIVNASLFKDVVMIESVKPCIDAANVNIKENNIANAKAIVLDAKNLKKINFSERLFVITDPPRSGMDQKTIEELNKLEPEVIVYISCNHMQLGKDLLKFKKYSIKSCAVFDLFPQTNHVETIVEMVRK